MPKGRLKPEKVFRAYDNCKEGKEDTFNAMQFASNYEHNCLELCERINNHTYHPARSIVFIVEKPVKREVFAPSFESRVGDHVVADSLMPILDRYLVDDNYATRKGRGTLYGCLRIALMMDEVTEGYTLDKWVMKTDIESFFMSLTKERLYSKIAWFVEFFYFEDDKMEIIFLLWAIIYDRPEKHCVRRCPVEYWNGLPPRKSLFNSDGRHGMPIGRLVSQMSVSLYLDPLDKFLKVEWGNPYGGRYVDDIVSMNDKNKLLTLRNDMDSWLRERELNLHPKKLYLQPCSKGVGFVGGFIRQGRIYATRRSVGFAFDAVAQWNLLAMNGPDFVEEYAERFCRTINSYLGHLVHFCGYNIRRKLVASICKEWWRVIDVQGDLTKVSVKVGYRNRDRLLRELKEWQKELMMPFEG